MFEYLLKNQPIRELYNCDGNKKNLKGVVKTLPVVLSLWFISMFGMQE